MKVHDIVGDRDWLAITDLENMFEARPDRRGNYMYNLNESLYLDVPESQLREFTCDARMHWPLISYKIYGTTRLAWLLIKINKVETRDVFKAKLPSETVKYVDKEVVQGVVRAVNGYEEY